MRLDPTSPTSPVASQPPASGQGHDQGHSANVLGPAPKASLPGLSPAFGADVLRFTWTSDEAALKGALHQLVGHAEALWPLRQQYRLRLAVPVLLDERTPNAMATGLLELTTLAKALGFDVDLAPRLPSEHSGGALNTHTSPLFHERLLPLLSFLARRLENGSEDSVSAGNAVDVPGVVLPVEPGDDTVEGGLGVSAGSVFARAKMLPRLLGGLASAVWDARQGRRDLIELARDLRALPFAVMAVTPPPLLPVDSVAGAAAHHWLLGCPDDVDGTPLFGPAAAQCFAPLLAPVAGGHTRADQHQVVSLWAARHRERSHAIALGPLRNTRFGDGAAYVAASHVKQDLRAARALGFSDITIASLDGLLYGQGGEVGGAFRDDVDQWFEAFEVN